MWHGSSYNIACRRTKTRAIPAALQPWQRDKNCTQQDAMMRKPQYRPRVLDLQPV